MEYLFGGGVDALPTSGALTDAVDAWAGAVDGVPPAGVQQARMLASVLETLCASVARDAAAGRGTPAAQLAAVTKVSRELREALRAVEAAAAKLSRERDEKVSPLDRLLGELSAPVVRHTTGP